MARKFDSVDFVTIKLQESDRKAFTTWAQTHVDDIYVLTGHLLDAGYKVSASYDPANACYILACTGKENASHNTGKCFTSRARDYEEAIMLMLYKHWELAKGESWSNIVTSQSDWG